MADLVITPADVKQGAGKVGILKSVITNEDIDAGETVRLLNSKASLANANSVLEAGFKGVALNSAAAGQPVDIAFGGEIVVGAAVVVAAVYVLSPTDGKMVECDDVALVSGKIINVVGVGAASNRMVLGPLVSGQAVP